nr:MAG TPA: hypothetical protein [Caudoviricetes sp.]
MRKARRRFKVFRRCPANFCGFKTGRADLFKNFPCVLLHLLTSCYTFGNGERAEINKVIFHKFTSFPFYMNRL